MEKAKEDQVRDAFRERLDVTVELDGNFTISVVDVDPKRAAAIANAYVDVANDVSERIFRRESRLNRKYLENRLRSTDSVLTFLADTLQKFSRIYKIYEPEKQAQNVGKALIDLRAEIIKQEITLELMKNRYGESDPQTSMQREVIEELKSKLNDAENLPGFSGNFSLKNATKVGLEYTRMFAEYETYTKVKAFLLPMLEEQKINAFRKTFSFIVLDEAIPPDVKDGPRRSLYLMGSFFGSFFLAIVFIAFLVQYRELMSRYNTYKNRNVDTD
jgi:capsule polysaccharide export protein KpsE/RkpR